MCLSRTFMSCREWDQGLLTSFHHSVPDVSKREYVPLISRPLNKLVQLLLFLQTMVVYSLGLLLFLLPPFNLKPSSYPFPCLLLTQVPTTSTMTLRLLSIQIRPRVRTSNGYSPPETKRNRKVSCFHFC